MDLDIGQRAQNKNRRDYRSRARFTTACQCRTSRPITTFIGAFLCVWLLSCITITEPAYAQYKRDHNAAKRAVDDGIVVPLASVLPRVRKQTGGQILDTRLLRGRGTTPWRYRIKVLTPDGTVRDVVVNAQNGKVLGIR
jgi:hypothetical protein